MSYKVAFVLILVTITMIDGKGKYRHWHEYGASGHPFGRCYRRGKVVPCNYNPGPSNYFPTTFKPKRWPMKTTKMTTITTTEATTKTITMKPTKAITTPPPYIEESKKIREMYNIARALSSDNLFAFTKKDADNFTSRVFDEIVKPYSSCNKTLPAFTDCKVRELAFILKNNQCSSEQPNQTTTTSSSGNSRRRVRRETGQSFRNRDGSISRVMSCSQRGKMTRNKGLRLCTTCFVVTELPAGRFPRYINEATCDVRSFPRPGDRTCFFGNGQCIEQFVDLQFIRDERNVGIQRLGQWRQYKQRIRSGCNCGMSPDSPLSIFVV